MARPRCFTARLEKRSAGIVVNAWDLNAVLLLWFATEETAADHSGIL